MRVMITGANGVVGKEIVYELSKNKSCQLLLLSNSKINLKNKKIKLIYQDLDDLTSAVKEGNPDISEFDTSCFSGKYVTEGVDDKFLENLSKTTLRSDL